MAPLQPAPLAMKPLAASMPLPDQKPIAMAPPLAPLPTNPSPTTSRTSNPATTTTTTTTSSTHTPVAASPMMPVATAVTMTTKEWVIPPRPKPGRKPATDTPPTKRKAQNRAAQRAFRERRAARVSELEDQLDDVRQEHEQQEGQLRDTIHALEMDLQSYRSRCSLLASLLDREREARVKVEAEAEELRRRCARVHHPHADPYTTQHQKAAVRRPSGVSHPMMTREAEGAATKPASSSSHAFTLSTILSPPDSASVSSPQELELSPSSPLSSTPLACSGCGSRGHCLCRSESEMRSQDRPWEDVDGDATLALCLRCRLGQSQCRCAAWKVEEAEAEEAEAEVILSKDPSLLPPPPPILHSNKRSLSPNHVTSPPKRSFHASYHHTTANASSPLPGHLRLETDMTHTFRRSGLDAVVDHPVVRAVSPPPPSSALPNRERCGFCQDGSYCVCADTTLGLEPPEERAAPPRADPDRSVLGGFLDMALISLAPPGDASSPKNNNNDNNNDNKDVQKTVAVTAASGGCGPNGPGTCAQCVADPRSGEFCRSLAAVARSTVDGAAAAAPDGCGSPHGCCRDAKPMGPTDPDTTPPHLPPTKASLSPSQTHAQSPPHIIQPDDDASQTAPSQTAAEASAAELARRRVALPSLGETLSCAEAYRRLSAHPHYDRAADDLPTWLPKLRALRNDLPGPRTDCGPSGRRGTGGGGGGSRCRGRVGRAPAVTLAAYATCRPSSSSSDDPNPYAEQAAPSRQSHAHSLSSCPCPSQSHTPAHTQTTTATAAAPAHRHPMEVEAASIMSVLRDFDVRFGGRDAR